MPKLKLHVLGAPYLEVDGQLVEVQRRKVLALLAYLAVTAEPHSRDTLATLLWPDVDQSRARAALSRHLSELRTIIGEESVNAGRHIVDLAGDIWLDVRRFQLLAARLDGNVPTALESLSQAVALYRADFLTGFTLSDCPEFDEWQFFQSEALRQQFAIALENLVDIQLAHGDIEAAIPHARRRLALDSLHEPAHRRLMKLYALTGQQAAALRQYQFCVQTLAEELGVPPSEETTALHEQIRTGMAGRVAEIDRSTGERIALPSPSRTPTLSHNLPAQLTPFVGREVELAALDDLLGKPEGRLVTIVGPGGMGKTRLALAAAEAQLAATRFSHGVFFVSLAPLSEVEDMVYALAEAVGHTWDPEEQVVRPARIQLLNYLRERQILLVLDNFEHLLDGVALVDDVLQAAVRVRVLATSRERLHLHGEQLFPIRGLEYPDPATPADAATNAAVKLFVQSARRVQPQFELTAADLAQLTRICQLVEGMPLAIELAAGWVDLLSLADIGTEIQLSLDFLETNARNVPDRQRSMRAVFDRTWERLDEQEQYAFSSLSVFRGGITRQAAQAVTGASLRLLSLLAGKSLLRYDDGVGRYQIHELLRQYAAEQLEAGGQTEMVRDAHAVYFANLLQQKEADLKGHGQRRAKSEIMADFENIRRAWLWAVERRDYATLERAIEGLYWFLHHDSQHYRVGQNLFQTGRERLAPTEPEEPHPVWGKLLARVLPFGSGEFEAPLQAMTWLEQALAIAEARADAAEQAFCRWLLVRCKIHLGDFDSLVAECEQCLRYYRQAGDRFYIAWTLKAFSEIHNRLREPRQAVGYLQQSLQLFRELGISEFPVMTALALTLARLGDFEQAETHLRRAYKLSQAEGNPSDMAGALVYLSRILSNKGEPETAQAMAAAALAVAEENNIEYRQLQARMDLGIRAYERGDFEQALAHLTQVQDRPTTHGNQVRIEYVLGLTMYHLGKNDVSREYLVNRLHRPVTLALYSLPLAALRATQTGNLEQATGLLALFTLHDSLSSLLGTRILSELQSLRQTLATSLPPESFATAWKWGQSLDLATTIADLADELSRLDV